MYSSQLQIIFTHLFSTNTFQNLSKIETRLFIQSFENLVAKLMQITCSEKISWILIFGTLSTKNTYCIFNRRSYSMTFISSCFYCANLCNTVYVLFFLSSIRYGSDMLNWSEMFIGIITYKKELLHRISLDHILRNRIY